MKDNIDYRYRDDAFDLRRASDNPLQENQAEKVDWDKSNKDIEEINVNSYEIQLKRQMNINNYIYNVNENR